MKKLVSITLFFAVFVGFAQNIHESDKMWSKKVIRAIDLREKQNLPFYARGIELPTILMTALRDGKLKAYKNDSLNPEDEISVYDCLNTMTIPSNFIEEDTAYMTPDEIIEYKERQASAQNSVYFDRDLYQIEVTEEIIFDKNHSVLERNIIAITVFVPADHYDNEKGIQEPVATFDYQECIKLFNTEPNAIWFNRYNDSAHLTMADAFELGMYSSYLVKVSNPEGEYIVDKYGGDPIQGIYGAFREESQIMEFEHNLWEN